MSTRDDAADAALVADHAAWLADASRKDIKTRFGVGSGRATRLRELARVSQGRVANPVSESRIAQSGHSPTHSGQEDSLRDSGKQSSRSGNPHRDVPPVTKDRPWRKLDPFEVLDSPTIVCVPDIHLEHNQDMRRMSWLGRYARDTMTPNDILVFGGDTTDGTSMCTHLSEGEREGLRFQQDCEASKRGLDLFFRELPSNPNERPHIEHVWGNHVWARLNRYVKEHPWLMGFLDDPDRWFGWADYGVTGVPYQEPLRMRGWRFQHNLPNGGRGTVGGKYAGAALLRRLNFGESICTFHTHKLNMHCESSAAGGRRWGITAGCFFEHREDYAQEDSNAGWDRGLVRLDYACQGDASVVWKPIEQLEAMYADEDEAAA